MNLASKTCHILFFYSIFIAFTSLSSPALSHHSVPAEYGSDSPLVYVEGTIVQMLWVNPHVGIAITTTGGDVESGLNYRVMGHPINIMSDTYAIEGDEFQVGDKVALYGRLHIRGMPLIQMRAISVNDGAMRSALEHRDLQDFITGDIMRLSIVPSPSLNGTVVNRRIGPDDVQRLKDLGVVDENNIVRLENADFRSND